MARLQITSKSNRGSAVRRARQPSHASPTSPTKKPGPKTPSGTTGENVPVMKNSGRTSLTVEARLAGAEAAQVAEDPRAEAGRQHWRMRAGPPEAEHHHARGERAARRAEPAEPTAEPDEDRDAGEPATIDVSWISEAKESPVLEEEDDHQRDGQRGSTIRPTRSCGSPRRSSSTSCSITHTHSTNTSRAPPLQVSR